MSNEKLSDNERLKGDSERLRGTITDDLANPLTVDLKVIIFS